MSSWIKEMSRNFGFYDNNATASGFSFEVSIPGRSLAFVLAVVMWFTILRVPRLPDIEIIPTQKQPAAVMEPSKQTRWTEMVLDSTYLSLILFQNRSLARAVLKHGYISVVALWNMETA